MVRKSNYMNRYGPKLARYSIIVVFLTGASVSALGTLLTIYDTVHTVATWLPALPESSLFGLLFSPVGLLTMLGVGVATIVVARRRGASLTTVTVGAVKAVDSVFGWSLFDEPDLEGRFKHDGVAWRFHYWAGGHVEAVQRECPRCGMELVERVLPREVVHGPNTGFDPGEASRDTAEEAWADVYGREKAEDHGETLAMACPDCNVSVPGSADVLDGKDAAHAKFTNHVERMQAADSRGDLFAAYVPAAREAVGGEPTPSDIWDAYVRAESPEDCLQIAPDTSFGEDEIQQAADAERTGTTDTEMMTDA